MPPTILTPVEKFLYSQFQKSGIRRDRLMSDASSTQISSIKAELPSTLSEKALDLAIEDRQKRGHFKVKGDQITLTEKGLKAFEKV